MKVVPRRVTSILLVLLMTLSIMPTFAATAFADVDPCTVTFVYDENNRNLDVEVTVDAGGKVAEPVTPARAGCQFLGWYDSTDKAFNFTQTVINADLTLIAYWASGTEDDPYLIGDMDSLRWMQAVLAGSDGVTYRTKDYVLTADIVSDGASFNPIPSFSGTLDGQGHTISGLAVNGGGLFSTLSGTIKNLGLADITVALASYTGAIAGQTSGAFTIENCYATGRVNGGSWYTGGLVGYSNASSGRISNCYFSGSVISSNRSPGNYINMYGVGGIAGCAIGTDIANCYSAGSVTGDVTGNSDNAFGVGGILGDSQRNTTVQKCYSTSAVKGYDYVGGIVGAINSGSVTDCVALNSIVWAARIGSYGNSVGRVSGYGATTGCYAWEGIPVLGAGGSSQGQGTPLSLAEINTAAGWPPIFSSGAWSYTNGQLPTLSGLGGQDGAMPGWLRPLGAGMDWRVTIFYDDGITVALLKDVADQGTVQPPDDPVRGDYKFMGWYELGATVAFDFASPITANVYLFANWAAPGTAANPYLIASMDELRWMADMINNNTAYRRMYYELTEDLVYDGQGFNAMLPLTGSGGVPQLNYDNAFMGQLDGAGHTVTGLPINGQGLFGFIYGGAVKNLGLIDVTVNGAGNHPYAGAIAGYLASGVSYQGTHYGVSTGLVENCYVINGDVSGEYTAGGLVGHVNDAICAIKNSYYRGAVAGTANAGGIAGNNNGIIENTYTAGSVSGDTVGGIAGRLATGATLTNSYSRSAVNGATNAGGIVGATVGDVYLATCLALNPSIQATTAETGRAGRVVGDLDEAGAVIDCYSWEDTTVSAAITDAGENGFALSTEYIKDGSGIPEVFTATPWAYTVGQLPVLIGLGAQETGFGPGAVTLGDVNGDGVIDFDDVLDALNHYLGTTALKGDALSAADVNKDGVLDFDDVLDILNHYLGTNLLDA